jgi:hypothetical protein
MFVISFLLVLLFCNSVVIGSILKNNSYWEWRIVYVVAKCVFGSAVRKNDLNVLILAESEFECKFMFGWRTMIDFGGVKLILTSIIDFVWTDSNLS